MSPTPTTAAPYPTKARSLYLIPRSRRPHFIKGARLKIGKQTKEVLFLLRWHVVMFKHVESTLTLGPNIQCDEAEFRVSPRVRKAGATVGCLMFNGPPAGTASSLTNRHPVP